MKYKGVVDVNKKGNKKGFTLVEIIVVLVILAILAAIAVPSVLGYVEQAKESEQLYKVRDALIASQTTLIRTYGTDGEFGDASVKYLHGENINTQEKSLFSLDKIREMLKADKFSEEAEIGLGTDMPLKLTLNMVTGDGKLSFLLAPRLESDE